jgi:hypothetical protein
MTSATGRLQILLKRRPPPTPRRRPPSRSRPSVHLPDGGVLSRRPAQLDGSVLSRQRPLTCVPCSTPSPYKPISRSAVVAVYWPLLPRRPRPCAAPPRLRPPPRAPLVGRVGKVHGEAGKPLQRARLAAASLVKLFWDTVWQSFTRNRVLEKFCQTYPKCFSTGFYRSPAKH